MNITQQLTKKIHLKTESLYSGANHIPLTSNFLLQKYACEIRFYLFYFLFRLGLVFLHINKFSSYNCLLNSTQDLHNFGWQIYFWKVLVQTGAAKRSRQLADQGTFQQELRPDINYFFPVWRSKESNRKNCEINHCYLGLHLELLQIISLLV